MAEGPTKHDGNTVKMVVANALVSGQVIQTPGGQAAVYVGMKAAVSGDYVTLDVTGSRQVAKTASIVFLPGQEVWWDVTNSKATYKIAGDFYVGVAPDGALAAASVVNTLMNVPPSYVLDSYQRSGEWTTEATDGLGVVEAYGGRLTLAFDAVAEVGQAAVFGSRTVNVSEQPIAEFELAIFDIGDHAALDINFGLADASHATDFAALSDYAAFHLDGSDLDILTTTDDTANPLTPSTAATDAVDDEFAFWQIDARDKTDVKFYHNGIEMNAAGAAILTASTADLFPIVHLEKTSNDTLADVRVNRITLRSAVPA